MPAGVIGVPRNELAEFWGFPWVDLFHFTSREAGFHLLGYLFSQIKSRIKELPAVVGQGPVGLQINEDLLPSLVCLKIGDEFGGVPLCHFEIVHQIMAAVHRRRSGDFLEAAHRFI